VLGLPANAVVGFEIVRSFIASAKTGCQANAKKFAQIIFRVARKVTQNISRNEEVRRTARIKLLSGRG
jgi:tRNA/tmRNA/rRNA uracil-C5-methylase (TrmA/RlmC/RlmD family)